MIRTQRLLLRHWRDADREPFAAMNADPAVREHLPGTLTREASDAFVDAIVDHWRSHGWGLWALEAPGTQPFIGYVGLWPADYITGELMVEVGWRLERRQWGNGYASEAAREALRFGFEQLTLNEIVSFTVAQNVRSIRVMERIGLLRDPAADFDHPRVDPRAYPQLVRQVMYRLRREQWLASEASSIG